MRAWYGNSSRNKRSKSRVARWGGGGDRMNRCDLDGSRRLRALVRVVAWSLARLIAAWNYVTLSSRSRHYRFPLAPRAKGPRPARRSLPRESRAHRLARERGSRCHSVAPNRFHLSRARYPPRLLSRAPGADLNLSATAEPRGEPACLIRRQERKSRRV